ncbi:hypothetical protein GQ44DRAFT_766275 [Phaeosphaeriaceae sp. PMI808]|nr:hypothetical protein GQ44DRAFT_766275 [Phaeosphaeriaceae sp. PMI808]
MRFKGETSSRLTGHSSGLGGYGFARKKAIFCSFQLTVADFISKKLTYDTGRLPAIAGFSREVFNETGGEYAAGLWKDNIFDDLIFVVNSSQQTIEEKIRTLRSQGDRPSNTPSWSWLGQISDGNRCGIKFETIAVDLKPEYQDISFNIKLNGKSKFGSIEYASMKIRTLMTAIPVRTNPHSGQSMDFKITPWVGDADDRFAEDPWPISYAFDEDYRVRYLHFRYPKGMELALVSSSEEWGLFGLILIPASRLGCYYCIGRFCYFEGYR